MIKLEIFTHPFADYKNLNLPWDYHCLYILENGKQVYIGETKDIARRNKEHLEPYDLCGKFTFDRIHVITGEDFEETPAKHYEDLLIRLMHADGKFEVINRKMGDWTHYKRKNDFELSFDRLWPELEKKGLVNEKHFYSVLNKGMYKYCPDMMRLTEKQQAALKSIINAINSKETFPANEKFRSRPILIRGDAGCGKTAVAVSLFYYLKTHTEYRKLKTGLVYANPSTRKEIKKVFSGTPELNKEDVISPVEATKRRYDILICDEAQRLRRNKNIGYYLRAFEEGNKRLSLDNSHDELDWLLAASDRLILFYDGKQIVSPSDIPENSFEKRVYDRFRGIRPIDLDEQMRIRAGAEYTPYVYDVLFQNTDRSKNFENYDFRLFTDFAEMRKVLCEKEEKYRLCRICSGGYGWKWVSKTNPETPDIVIDGCGVKWNRQSGGWLENDKAKGEMGSIYSLAGLDLNYTAVVFGPELYFDAQENKIMVDRKNYYDKKIKRGVSDGELRTFILNSYAVLMTRGIRGTYVYVCDVNLRRYLEKFIPTA